MLPVASGEDNLRPPEDVAIYIIDDNYTLKWNHHRESMGNVTFSAEYQKCFSSAITKLPPYVGFSEGHGAAPAKVC